MPLDDRVDVGAILFEYVTTVTPPKNKYYVVVGISDNNVALGTVYINSEINPNIFRKEEIRKLHIPLSMKDNPFLKWDSFIDCSHIHERSVSDIRDLINNSSGRYGYVSNLPPHTLSEVISTLDSAITIPPIIKKKFKIRR